MHAHNRTYLTSIGFADPDKKESLHDKACMYLAEKEQAEKLSEMVGPRKGERGVLYRKCVRAELEKPAKVRMFADVYVTGVWMHATSDHREQEVWSEFFIEVKILPTSLAEVLRQMNLYKQHFCEMAVLATAYDISEDEAAILKNENIIHVRLGDNFAKWCARKSEVHKSTDI